MTWGWNARKAKGIEVGGPVGTFAEARETKSWPNYDSAYLAKTLGATNPQSAEDDRFDMARINIPDGEARNVYLQHAVENYKAEADECLKNEFIDWLQGDHEDNATMHVYDSANGRAKRRALCPTNDGVVTKDTGQELEMWRPTWWGRNQLTHLDGVRPFLREMKVTQEENEFALNTLAEFGPNNIDQAWIYFKHWVKGRPVSVNNCLHETQINKPPSGPVIGPYLPGQRSQWTESENFTNQRSGPVNMAQSRAEMKGIAAATTANDVQMADAAATNAAAAAVMNANTAAALTHTAAVNLAAGPTMDTSLGINTPADKKAIAVDNLAAAQIAAANATAAAAAANAASSSSTALVVRTVQSARSATNNRQDGGEAVSRTKALGEDGRFGDHTAQWSKQRKDELKGFRDIKKSILLESSRGLPSMTARQLSKQPIVDATMTDNLLKRKVAQDQVGDVALKLELQDSLPKRQMEENL